MSLVGRRLIKMLKEDEWELPADFSRRYNHPASGFKIWSDGDRVAERFDLPFSDPVDLDLGYFERKYILRLLRTLRKKADENKAQQILKRMSIPTNVLPGDEE